jgi:hypothetical protein
MGMTAKEIMKYLDTISGDIEYVEFDFGAYPSYVSSWRGSYDLPCIVYDIDHLNGKDSLSRFKEMIKNIDGKEVFGYKGGDFILSEDSVIYIVPDSSRAQECVVDRLEVVNEYKVVIHTKYEEY